MLTVKHIDNDGTETLMEAERVEKVQTGDRFMDGVFLDRQTAEQADTSSPGRSFKAVFHFADTGQTGVPGPLVYVMNRFGATVATYHL